MFNLLYKLLLLYKDGDVVDPQDVDYSYNWDGLNTAGWFIVIFCLILFALGERDKHK